MAQYPDLATLRSALTANDAERRSKAYGVVYENTDLDPSTVLNDDTVAETLQETGVIETPEDRPSTKDQRDRIIELLESIEANTGGGN